MDLIVYSHTDKWLIGKPLLGIICWSDVQIWRFFNMLGHNFGRYFGESFYIISLLHVMADTDVIYIICWYRALLTFSSCRENFEHVVWRLTETWLSVDGIYTYTYLIKNFSISKYTTFILFYTKYYMPRSIMV